MSLSMFTRLKGKVCVGSEVVIFITFFPSLCFSTMKLSFVNGLQTELRFNDVDVPLVLAKDDIRIVLEPIIPNGMSFVKFLDVGWHLRTFFGEQLRGYGIRTILIRTSSPNATGMFKLLYHLLGRVTKL